MRSIILFITIVTLNVLFVWSCKDDDNGNTIDTDCRMALLEHFEMRPYVEGDTEFTSFIQYFENEGVYFAYWGNHLIEFQTTTLVDCDGNTICTSDESGCWDMVTDANSLGIIGVR